MSAQENNKGVLLFLSGLRSRGSLIYGSKHNSSDYSSFRFDLRLVSGRVRQTSKEKEE